MIYTDAQRQALTANEVAAWLRVSQSTIRRHVVAGIVRGNVQGFKVGTEWKFNVEDLLVLAERNDANGGRT